MNRQDLTPADEYEATYCPEDDKLRLYVGRVPRAEFEFLRAEGWTSTPKQSCDFVAHWTPDREKTALQYAGYIGDEDTAPTDRAADRAERFGGYLEKRTGEALGHADTFDSGPSAHGYQSAAKAERAAARHDRLADKAGTQWGKAEYWARRTAGVISHALYKSEPGVRMGRIKVLEAELRKNDKDHEEYAAKYRRVQEWAEDPDTIVGLLARRFYGGDKEKGEEVVCDEVQGYGKHNNPHPDATDSTPGYRFEHLRSDHPPTAEHYIRRWLRTHHDPEAMPRPWAEHIKLRIAYETQMLEAQGGRAAMVEMEAGGWIGKHQITKVTKSPATGRVVSVEFEYMSETNQYGRPWSDGKGARLTKALVNIERAGADVYRAPTDEERAAFAAKVAAGKKEKAKEAKEKASKGENCPLVNPTDEDAERLQAFWNEEAAADEWNRRNGAKVSEVLRMTQAEYAAASKGSYSRMGTVTVCEKGTKHETRHGSNITRRDVYKVRATSNGYAADRVIVITDKPQKGIPWSTLDAARAACPSPDKLKPHAAELVAILRKSWSSDWTEEQSQLVKDAQYCGLAFWSSMSQYGLTPAGEKWAA
jgi:hypothetical protein